MRKTFILDACALIAFLNDEEGANLVEKLLCMANARNASLLMNKVNLFEIYYGVYRDDGIEEAKNVLRKIENLPVKIIDTFTDEVFYEAGKLKATNRISLADAIAVAEANIRDVKLVTCDHHEFDALEKEKKMAAYWIR